MRDDEKIKTQTVSKGKVLITKILREVHRENHQMDLLEKINREKGAYFCSNFEYPGRYSRWDIGFENPALEITTKGLCFEIRGLTEKGAILLKIIYRHLLEHTHIKKLKLESSSPNICGEIRTEEEADMENLAEENRSRRPSVFSMIRGIQELFYITEAEKMPKGNGLSSEFLGLYGAYGYDLVFQFEEIEKNKRRMEKRQEEQADIHLFLPDEIFVVDHRLNKAFVLEYEFEKDGFRTNEFERRKITVENIESVTSEKKFGLEKNEQAYGRGSNYKQLVEKAIPHFLQGDFFEVVPSHVLRKNCNEKPSELFQELLRINPSPYGFLINLGGEHLIGASPEMYIRVEGNRVETCPISGTAKRGGCAIEDYENIMSLLNSVKEESELTMCTDVDRNDKSRICRPGTVKVIGRRQIEMYSHLMHTVDHVEGYLRDGFDGIDAFMTHMWAVTVTGAPKRAAMNWIEKNEESERGWYGGAVGLIGFDGNVNTGLTLRTIRLRKGIAEVRVGATVLLGSDPEGEEQETLTKGAALLEVIRRVKERNTSAKLEGAAEGVKEIYREEGKSEDLRATTNTGILRIIFIDHEDSFVHTLGSYFRKEGAEVLTIRHQKAMDVLQKNEADLVVLSPGPGKPKEFGMSEIISYCEKMDIAVFGVCLGMQGIIEHFGGTLGLLDCPKHGKTSIIEASRDSKILKNIGKTFKAGRYHSLYGSIIPNCLKVVGISKEDQLPMAIEHKEKRIFGVQFHPESIMTLKDGVGEKIIKNILEALGK